MKNIAIVSLLVLCMGFAFIGCGGSESPSSADNASMSDAGGGGASGDIPDNAPYVAQDFEGRRVPLGFETKIQLGDEEVTIPFTQMVGNVRGGAEEPDMSTIKMLFHAEENTDVPMMQEDSLIIQFELPVADHMDPASLEGMSLTFPGDGDHFALVLDGTKSWNPLGDVQCTITFTSVEGDVAEGEFSGQLKLFGVPAAESRTVDVTGTFRAYFPVWYTE